MPSMPGSIRSTMAASKGSERASLEALFGAGGQAHAVPLARQQRLEDLAHDFLVVDDEDGGCGAHALFSRVCAEGFDKGSRSVNRVPWPTLLSTCIDAVVLADDAVGDRQPETRALPD